MFRIKICGITNVADARVAAEAGADALGLNFFSKSRRFVASAAAREIAAAVPAGVTRVGVFVNQSAAEISQIITALGLDCVQLHGDEPAEIVSELPVDVKIVRAFRCGRAGLAPLASYLKSCCAVGRVPDLVLVDADAAGEFGGSGQRADWARVARERDLIRGVPLVLAGGLAPENVAEAIATVRPDGVDVASGVESSPGNKDAAKVRGFVAAARAAFAYLDRLHGNRD